MRTRFLRNGVSFRRNPTAKRVPEGHVYKGIPPAMGRRAAETIFPAQAENSMTVEFLITHTPRWTAQAVGYERSRGMLKIDSENHRKIRATG